ncbi:MAG: hypothetical protein COU47_02335 [Candidatus Niyogibacteria bacterium CG10_big_fil_rev_8_21_14_0_10_46_36]|uniref:Uncharacterized protein n=1 Tax=Candidatus Niyogibacteria bacterium CG10_big_fil_rev_8_21_14_0_10_46_36 TaxID=1974726 RepID=A0A2H0TDD1_9BACT|nr:MAG: hypothetical protein COU47_02335 [Candidatus Niyogibacteria bacterium CG10_big_fil_rev_8_21_14_0_10_46_36]
MNGSPQEPRDSSQDNQQLKGRARQQGAAPEQQTALPQQPEKDQGGLSRLRTFRADAERFVKEKGVSMTSLAAQQSKKKIVQAPEARTNYKKIIFILVIIVMLGGIGVAGFLFLQNGGMQIAPRIEKPAPVYPLFDERTITVRNSPSDFVPEWQNLLLRSIPEQQMLGVFVFNELRQRYLSPGEWFDFLGIQLPPSLRVSMTAPWTLGIFGTPEGAKPVFIIPVTSFEQAFAGMLAWEQEQPLAIRNLLPQGSPERKFERFQDTIIKNQDVRFLQNDQGQTILVYGFFNRKILIITTSLAAMERVIDRFLVTPPSL